MPIEESVDRVYIRSEKQKTMEAWCDKRWYRETSVLSVSAGVPKRSYTSFEGLESNRGSVADRL